MAPATHPPGVQISQKLLDSRLIAYRVVIGEKSPLHSLTDSRTGFWVNSQYVHPKHPPDEEYRDDGPRDLNYPVASGLRLPKIEHGANASRWDTFAITLTTLPVLNIACSSFIRL
jgi:hypothetical protein